MMVEEYCRGDGLAGSMLQSSSEHPPVRIVDIIRGGFLWDGFQEASNLSCDTLREQDTPQIDAPHFELGVPCPPVVGEVGGGYVDLGHEGVRQEVRMIAVVGVGDQDMGAVLAGDGILDR